MHYAESHGPSLKKARELKREKFLHHVRVYSHKDGTPKHPRWIVEDHHSEDDSEPTVHDFSSGPEMLRHIAESASVPSEGEMSTADGGEE